MLTEKISSAISDALTTSRKIVAEISPVTVRSEHSESALRSICLRFDELKSSVESGEIRQAIDPEFALNDGLDNVFETLRDLYRKLKVLDANGSALYEITSKSYTAAVRLQWAIGEHDIEYLPKKIGYVAHTADEVNQVLDQILSEK